jgi:hypothetical protein
MSRLAAFVVVALCLHASVASVASAATVLWDESTHGDLSPLWGTAEAFMLGEGTSTLSGTFSAPSSGPTEGDLDTFWIGIPDHLKLTSASVAISDVTGDVVSTAWVILSPDHNHHLGDVSTLVPGSDPFPALASGIYIIEHVGANGTGTAAYTFTFELEPIPEPASLSLLGFGSLALLARRRVRN